jgi:hypothetical protein
MIYARRNQLPQRIKVNKAGGISVMSFIRHLGLPDGTEFHVEVVNRHNDKRLILHAILKDAIYDEETDEVFEAPETPKAKCPKDFDPMSTFDRVYR